MCGSYRLVRALSFTDLQYGVQTSIKSFAKLDANDGHHKHNNNSNNQPNQQTNKPTNQLNNDIHKEKAVRRVGTTVAVFIVRLI